MDARKDYDFDATKIERCLQRAEALRQEVNSSVASVELSECMYASVFALRGLRGGVKAGSKALHMASKSYSGLANAINVAGSAAYVVIGVAETASALHELTEVSKQHRRKKMAYAAGAVRMVASNTITGASVATLLSHTGVLPSIISSIAMPVAGFAYAGIMWMKTAKSLAELGHAVRQYTDIEYQRDDIERRIVSVEYKLESLRALRQPSQSQLDKKIKLEKTRDMLVAKRALFTNPDALSGDQKKVYDALRQNQLNKIHTKAVESIERATMAAGFTMMAMSFACGPAAPFVMGAGIGVAAFGAAVKLVKFGRNKFAARAVKKMVQAKKNAGVKPLQAEELDYADESARVRQNANKKQSVNEADINVLVCNALGLKENAVQDLASLSMQDKMRILVRHQKAGLKNENKQEKELEGGAARLFNAVSKEADKDNDFDIDVKPQPK